MAAYDYDNGLGLELTITCVQNGFIVRIDGKTFIAKTLKEATKLVLKHFPKGK